MTRVTLVSFGDARSEGSELPTHKQFTEIAQHYDRLMSNVPYRLWVDYLRKILDRLGAKPKSVLDVACGTGNVAEEIYDRGYDVVGIDSQPEMIEIARRKAAESSRLIEYDVQDMTNLSVDRQFDLAVSLFDSFNYVTNPDDLARAMARIFERLVPGGLLIFDVNTEYALAHHFFDQCSLERYPRYAWTSYYDRRTRICRVEMAFEVLENGGKRQFTEVHLQRAYSTEGLRQMLEGAGFEVVDVFQAYTFKKPTRRSDRVFFVARRPAP